MTTVQKLFQDAPTAPELMLHFAAEGYAKTAKSIIIMTQDQSGVWDVHYSDMSVGDLCSAEKWLSVRTAKLMSGELKLRQVDE
jgi:hypothetical protein